MEEKVSRVRVDLQNADKAQAKMQELGKATKQVTVNMKELQETFKDAPNIINNFIKQVDKVNEKGHVQGSVTSRDKQALDVRSEDLSALLSDALKVSSGTTVKDSTTHRVVDSDTLKQLNEQAGKIIELLGSKGISASVSTSSQQGIMGASVSTQGSNVTQAYSQTVRDGKKRASDSFFSDSELDTISNILNTSKTQIRSANSIMSNARRTEANIEATKNSGVVTYKRNNQYETFYKTKAGQLNSSKEDIRQSQKDTQSKITQLDALDAHKQAELKRAKSSDEAQEIERYIQSIRSYKEKLELNLNKLNETAKSLENSSTNLDSSKSDYNKAKQTEQLQVEADPNSFMGKLKSQSLNIAQRVVGTAGATISGAISQGNSIRSNSYDSGTGSIMMGLANNGVVGHKMDDKILSNLTNTALNNGTRYTGQEMVQFANAYASSNRTGDIKDYDKQADAISKMARYTGMSNDSTNQLISTAGLSGVTDMVGLSKVVSGALQNSNMMGRSSEMASALSTMLQNSANVGNMTSTESQRTAAFQGIMNGTHKSELQGQQGATAYNSMVNGITNTNSNYARQLFAQSSGNASKYSGAEGSFQLSLDMENARKDPSKLKGVLDTLNENTGGNTYLMAQQLQSVSPNLSATQAKDLAELYEEGNFDKKHIDKIVKSDKKKGNDNTSGKDAYSSSGKSTLDFSIAVDEKGSVSISKGTDAIRGVSASLQNVTGVAGGMVFDALSQASGNLLSAYLGSLFTRGKGSSGTHTTSTVSTNSKHISGKSNKKSSGTHKKTSRVRSAVSGIKDFGSQILTGVATDWVFDKATGGIGKVFSKVKGGKTLSGLSKLGKSALSGAKGLASKGLSKGKSLLSGAKGLASKGLAKGKSALGKVASKGSKVLESAKGLGKAGEALGKGSKLLGRAGGILAVAPGLIQAGTSVFSKENNTKKGKGIGSGLGSAGGAAGGAAAGAAIGSIVPGIGTAIGGVVGGIAGGFLGDKAGGWLGGTVGSWFDHSKKKKKKSSKDSGVTKKQSTYISKQKKLIKQFNSMLDKAEKVIALAKSASSDSNGSDSGDYGSSSNSGKSKASDWKDDIQKAAKAMGQEISDSQVDTLVRLIQAESGGNADVGKGIDDHDGTGAAIGLLQYKQSTFDAYKVSGHDDINNGYDQLLAFFNNSNWSSDLAKWSSRYSSGQTGWGPTGSAIKHARGGLYATATLRGTQDIVGEQGLEAAIPLNGSHYDDGKRTIKNLAGAFGMTLLDNSSNSNNNQKTSVNVTPSYNLSVNLDGTENPQDVQDAVYQELAQSKSDLNKRLLNYYSQDIVSI